MLEVNHKEIIAPNKYVSFSSYLNSISKPLPLVLQLGQDAAHCMTLTARFHAPPKRDGTAGTLCYGCRHCIYNI